MFIVESVRIPRVAVLYVYSSLGHDTYVYSSNVCKCQRARASDRQRAVHCASNERACCVSHRSCAGTEARCDTKEDWHEGSPSESPSIAFKDKVIESCTSQGINTKGGTSKSRAFTGYASTSSNTQGQIFENNTASGSFNT